MYEVSATMDLNHLTWGEADELLKQFNTDTHPEVGSGTFLSETGDPLERDAQFECETLDVARALRDELRATLTDRLTTVWVYDTSGEDVVEVEV